MKRPYLIFTNATVFFVLIAGFLFQRLNDNAAFRYGPLMRKKFRYVYLPMLVMSLPMMGYLLFAGEGFTLKKLIGLTVGLPLGLLPGPYWYIPFIMLVFAASPLIRRFIRLPGALLFTLITILVCFFFFPRTFSLWPSVIPYFFPLFILGALMSYRYDRLQGPIARRFWLWGLLSAACMAGCMFLPSELPRYAAKYFNVSIVAGIQSVCSGSFKVFLALFFWGLLIRYEHREIKLLDLFATYSFGIYFVHSYFLSIGLAAYSSLWPGDNSLSLLVTLLYCFAVPMVSLGTSMLIKRMIPRYSRFIAGV